MIEGIMRWLGPRPCLCSHFALGLADYCPRHPGRTRDLRLVYKETRS